MKVVKNFIIMFLGIFMPIYVFASSSVTVDKTSLTIDEGGSATFKITATNAAGKVDISSKDSSVATVNTSSSWVENGSITVKVTGVKAGSTTINIKIDAAGFDETVIQTTKSISVKVSGNKSSNNNLSDLKINGQTISGFSSSKTSYSYSTDDSSVTIAATTEDSNAKVSGTGSKSLKYGSNKFSIKVTAENGSAKTYTVTVNKKDDRNSNNYLKSLKITPGTIDFDKNNTSYTVVVDETVTEITINAEAENSKSKVTGTGTKKLGENNVFKVVVKAENESTRTYTIDVKINIDGEVEIIDDEKKTYTLKYDEESYKYCSSSYKDTIEVEEGNEWGSLCMPVKEGYTFVGWFTEKEGGERIYETSLAKSDIIIYAHFDKLVNASKFSTPKVILLTILSFVLGGLTTILAMRLFDKIKPKNI